MHDVIEATSVPEDNIDEHDFEYVAGYVILQLIGGRCYCSENSISEEEFPTAHFFVDDLLTEFGNGTHLTVEQFHLLYWKLKLGRKLLNQENRVNDGVHEDHEEDDHHRHRRWSSDNKVIVSFFIDLM